MRRRRGWLIVSLCLALAVLIAGGALLGIRGDWRYRIGLRFRRYPEPDLAVQTPPGAWVTVDAADLAGDPRVTLTDNLLLVNGTHPVPENYDPVLTEDGGCPMLPVALAAFRQLNETVKAVTGTRLYVLSGWRTPEEQEQEWQNGGEQLAAKPGYSEHQLGLALDVCVLGYGGMAFLKTEAGRYVNDRCGEYGFIIRYPDGKRSWTGMGYEPWHLRYVGAPHAQVMMDSGLTFEEYLGFLTPDTWFYSHDCWILRTQAETVRLPEAFASCIVSSDNLGYRIYTLAIA